MQNRPTSFALLSAGAQRQATAPVVADEGERQAVPRIDFSDVMRVLQEPE
jgi:hypothetical protein